MAASVPPWQEPLLRKLADDAPARCLLLCRPGHAIARELRVHLPGTEVRVVEPSNEPLPEGERFDLALVAGAIEALEGDAARRVLASLRDLLAQHVVLLVDLEHSPLSDADLRALGFRQHARDGARALFGFDLYDYKDRPEWLNARYWAHPELWDKYRW